MYLTVLIRYNLIQALGVIMSVFERLMMGFIFAAAPALALFNVGWHLFNMLYDGKYIVLGAIAGLVIGILIDIVFFRKVLLNAYNAGFIIPIFIYVFYMLCLFLCFKKLPVAGLVIGIMAGYYEGRKLFHYKANSFESSYRIERTAQLTSAGIAVYCMGSTFIIFTEYDDTLTALKQIFNINPLNIKVWMVLASIILFSIILIFLQFWLTKKTATYAMRKESKK